MGEGPTGTETACAGGRVSRVDLGGTERADSTVAGEAVDSEVSRGMRDAVLAVGGELAGRLDAAGTAV